MKYCLKYSHAYSQFMFEKEVFTDSININEMQTKLHLYRWQVLYYTTGGKFERKDFPLNTLWI